MASIHMVLLYLIIFINPKYSALIKTVNGIEKKQCTVPYFMKFHMPCVLIWYKLENTLCLN